MITDTLPKTFIRVPERRKLSRLRIALWLLTGALLQPVYCLLAAIHGGPGLAFRRKCFFLALRLLLMPKAPRPMLNVVRLFTLPMDSTRYFEFGYADGVLGRLSFSKYLDVSSPRQVPVILAMERGGFEADLINPDVNDLAETRAVVEAAGLAARLRLHGKLISEVPFPPASFDVITCISVLEHIPDDAAAVRKMWDLLKPGGTLVLTVPVMARACEQYIDQNEYGLYARNEDGFVFWQRFYDSKLLQKSVFDVIGPPSQSVVFGEKVAGSFLKNAEQKRRGKGYPFWREPYMMAREYGYFPSVDQLPGEGVIGMTFVKR